MKDQEPSVNWTPIVIVVTVLIIVGFAATQASWIGQLMNRAPQEQDPIDRMTWQEARSALYTRINEGLNAVGAKNTKYTWTQQGKEIDPNTPGPIELTINTSLPDPNQRRSIIDPAKEYMPKAQVATVTMNDEKSHAMWTYQVQGGVETGEDEAQRAPAPQPQQQYDQQQQYGEQYQQQ